MLDIENALIPHTDSIFIGGEWVQPSSSATIDVINPATEELFARVAEAREPDIARAVQAARKAFDTGPWPRMSHAERAVYLRKMGDGLIARGQDTSRIWTSEMGVTISASSRGAGGIGHVFHYYASLAETFAFEEQHKPLTGGTGLLVREPVGVVAAIIPWNAPLALLTYKVAPALLAGCTVVVKASPEAPGSAYVVAEVAREIGLPEGVFNMVMADRVASESLVVDRRIDKVTFTGSCAAGRRIASICGERMARFTLELGGKSAGILLDDYDVEVAAKYLARYLVSMTGQVCGSLTRLIVGRDRHDHFVEAMAAELASVKVGDPFDPATGMGPLVSAKQRERVEGYIASGKAQGAKLATGGGRPAHLDRGFFVEPTLFGNVDNDMTIAREEIFGPVFSVIPADDEQHAIDIANDSEFGLNGAVFTNDSDKAYRIARQIRTGTVGQNGSRPDFGIAFGGFKQSGIGREGGTEGLMPFLETKTIVLDNPPSHLSK
jgi:aldehyde dehydrogenase (NAD+)